MKNIENKTIVYANQLIDHLKESILRDKGYSEYLWGHLVRQGYSKSFEKEVIEEAYRQIAKENFQILKKNEYDIDKNHKIKINKIFRHPEKEGLYGLAKLIYLGNNPIIKKEKKGISFHDDEGEIKGFLNLNYYRKLKKKDMPSEREANSTSEYNRDYAMAYKRGAAEELLGISKMIHQNPTDSCFADFVWREIERGLDSEDILSPFMKKSLENKKQIPLIFKK